VGKLTKAAVPVGVVSIVLMLVVPLPAAVLDLLLGFNIAASLLILLVSMNIRRPLDFAIFPSLVLIATLLRLALNVSSTRLVLSDGYAGKVIEAFGHFVIGGSLIVGLVIFIILTIIQFVVITNGAGRVAEVGARFTLDAMPGKQMAIDADLNAGLINEAQARRRRTEVTAEADFYGSMDGASKFVKGDAIAAIIVTLINLIGGFAIGVMQKGMSPGEAVSTYSLLSVGDGLVSQIPALLISTATGLIVTRSAAQGDMGSDLLAQLGRNKQPVRIAGIASIALCLIPGLPKLPFLLIGGLFLLAASRLTEKPDVDEDEAPKGELEAAEAQPDSPEAIADRMRVDPLELEVAFDLVELVDTARGGDLLDRVKALRRKVAMETGLVIPLVRTRDNLDLPASQYVIWLNGVPAATGCPARPPASRSSGWPPSGCPPSCSGRPRWPAPRWSTAPRSSPRTWPRSCGRTPPRCWAVRTSRCWWRWSAARTPPSSTSSPPRCSASARCSRCCRRCWTRACPSATWCASSRRCRCAPRSPPTSTAWSRPCAPRWARRSATPTSPTTSDCTSSRWTPRSSSGSWSRCGRPRAGRCWRSTATPSTSWSAAPPTSSRTPSG
jgi:hypothetical protein